MFIKVTTARGGQTGSGFLMEKSKTMGYIVSNAHVVQDRGQPARKVECVFHSGTRNEMTLAATVVGADSDRDLAILKVRHDQLPAPLDLKSKVKVRETSPVYIVGFPFGDFLATSRRNPAATISKGTVSSIRRDDYDNVKFVQIDGGINPGNSGGPLVDSSGALVGIAVAKIAGTQIGMAIPPKQLSPKTRNACAQAPASRSPPT